MLNCLQQNSEESVWKNRLKTLDELQCFVFVQWERCREESLPVCFGFAFLSVLSYFVSCTGCCTYLVITEGILLGLYTRWKSESVRATQRESYCYSWGLITLFRAPRGHTNFRSHRLRTCPDLFHLFPSSVLVLSPCALENIGVTKLATESTTPPFLAENPQNTAKTATFIFIHPVTVHSFIRSIRSIVHSGLYRHYFDTVSWRGGFHRVLAGAPNSAVLVSYSGPDYSIRHSKVRLLAS